MLRDCEYIRQKRAVRAFLESIKATVEARGNVTTLQSSTLPVDVAEWLSYHKLREQCRRNHRQMKRLARRKVAGSEKDKKRAEKDIQRLVFLAFCK